MTKLFFKSLLQIKSYKLIRIKTGIKTPRGKQPDFQLNYCQFIAF